MSQHETEWEHKDKMWTYLLGLLVLIALVVAVNVVWKDPSRAEDGMKSFVGLPSWLLASIAFVVGALVYWVGLKMEPDWPEAVGAFLVAGAIAWFELIVGWNKFNFGGLVVAPYLIPVVTFVLLLVYAVRNSR